MKKLFALLLSFILLFIAVSSGFAYGVTEQPDEFADDALIETQNAIDAVFETDTTDPDGDLTEPPGQEADLYSLETAADLMLYYDANGGAGYMADQEFIPGVPQPLNLNAYTRIGYNFLGWATNPTAARSYINGQMLSIGYSQTFYAVWDDYGNTFYDAFKWMLNPGGLNSMAGTIDYAKDNDMFEFIAPVTGTYLFYTSKLDTSIYYLDLYLYNSVQNQLTYCLALPYSTVTLVYELTAGQTYYLKAEGYTGTGAYTINIGVPSTPGFKVQFKPNDGTGYMADQTFTPGVAQALSYNRYGRNGYTFLGWATSPTAAREYNDEQVIVVTGDMILYAVWDDYGNSFNDASKWSFVPGATNSRAGRIDYTKDDDMFTFIAPVTGTYTFLTNYVDTGLCYLDLYLYNSSQSLLAGKLASPYGTVSFQYNLIAGEEYYLKAEGYLGTGAYVVSIVVPQASGYTLNYDANGGDVAPAPEINPTHVTTSKPTKGKFYTVTLNTNGGFSYSIATTRYCKFTNWNTNAAGTGKIYEPGAPYTEGATATLFAQWEDPDLGYLSFPTREGFRFIGWYTAQAGGEPAVPSLIVKSDMTIYARWEQVGLIQTVTFVANGGTGYMASQHFTSGVPQPLNANTFTRTGYKFIGWATSPVAAHVYSDMQSIWINSELYLYAVWDDYGNSFADAFNWTLAPGINKYNSRACTIDYFKDDDMFRFVATMTGSYTMSTSKLDSSIRCLDLYLYDSSQNLIAHSLASPYATASLSLSLIGGQVYYLKAEGNSGIGAYTISIDGPYIIVID